MVAASAGWEHPFGGRTGPISATVQYPARGLVVAPAALSEGLRRAFYPHAREPVEPGPLDLEADEGLGAA